LKSQTGIVAFLYHYSIIQVAINFQTEILYSVTVFQQFAETNAFTQLRLTKGAQSFVQNRLYWRQHQI